MSNSRWKSWKDVPNHGTFLVWAPDRPDGRKPYLGSNIATCKRALYEDGCGTTIINGHFHFDVAEPVWYCEMDDLLDQVPMGESE